MHCLLYAFIAQLFRSMIFQYFVCCLTSSFWGDEDPCIPNSFKILYQWKNKPAPNAKEQELPRTESSFREGKANCQVERKRSQEKKILLNVGFSLWVWNSMEDLCGKLVIEALLIVSLLVKTLNWKGLFTMDFCCLRMMFSFNVQIQSSYTEQDTECGLLVMVITPA